MCIPGRIEIGNIGFCGGGKTEEPRKKNSQSKERTKNELYRHEAGSVNRTRAILVGGGRYDHCQFEPNIIFVFLLLRIKNPLMLYIYCSIGHSRCFILYFKASSGKVFVMNVNPHSFWSNYHNKNFTLWLALKKTEGNSEVAYCLDEETYVLRLHLLRVRVVSTWSKCIYNLDGFYSQVAICADPPGFKRINWRVA